GRACARGCFHPFVAGGLQQQLFRARPVAQVQGLEAVADAGPGAAVAMPAPGPERQRQQAPQQPQHEGGREQQRRRDQDGGGVVVAAPAHQYVARVLGQQQLGQQGASQGQDQPQQEGAEQGHHGLLGGVVSRG